MHSALRSMAILALTYLGAIVALPPFHIIFWGIFFIFTSLIIIVVISNPTVFKKFDLSLTKQVFHTLVDIGVISMLIYANYPLAAAIWATQVIMIMYYSNKNKECNVSTK